MGDQKLSSEAELESGVTSYTLENFIESLEIDAVVTSGIILENTFALAAPFWLLTTWIINCFVSPVYYHSLIHSKRLLSANHTWRTVPLDPFFIRHASSLTL